MAGDWIKMGTGLRRHPKVVRILSALNADKLRVVGALHAVWSVFDEHSADGFLPGYTAGAMDEEIGFSGFCAAMAAVGWLEIGPDGLRVPEYEEHNGPTAKRRALDLKRKTASREGSPAPATATAGRPQDLSADVPKTVQELSASDADKLRTREEKRRYRERHPHTPTAFDRFWAAYPKRKSRGDAEKAFKAINPSEQLVDAMIASIDQATTSADWLKEGGRFIPHPATWLRDKRWLDEQDPRETVAAKTSSQLRLAGGFVP